MGNLRPNTAEPRELNELYFDVDADFDNFEYYEVKQEFDAEVKDEQLSEAEVVTDEEFTNGEEEEPQPDPMDGEDADSTSLPIYSLEGN